MTLILLTLLISYILLFLYSLRIRDNSIVDVFWGVGFMMIALLSFFQSEMNLVQIVMTGLVCLWWVRIVSHIGLRKWKEQREDPRYAKWREEWWSGWYFLVRSFLQVYIAQMVLMFVVAIPILVVNFVDTSYDSIFCNQTHILSKIINENACKWLDEGSWIYASDELQEIAESPKRNHTRFIFNMVFLWVIISLFGLIAETLADMQLSKFIKTKKPGQIFMTGLYRYSRHPNYFGESMFWLGISLISLPFSSLGLIWFIVITFLLLFVSWVPLQEARYAGRPEWEAYKSRTSVLIPWWPKK